jgi:membrane-bound lytic murein transglycosylase B
MRRAAALAAALLLAACSSDSGHEEVRKTDSTVTRTTETTAPASTTTTTTVDLTSRPAVPSTAEEAGAMLEAAEAVIHDEALADDDPRVARAAHEEQVAIRAIADHPGWEKEVGAPWVDAAVDDATAGRELRSLVRTPKPTLPAWTIVEPAPAAELRGYYQEAEQRFGVPWEYLAAVHLTETKMGRIRGTSTAGARGPMQFLPSTWEAYGLGGDIESNRDAILGAANYLKANGGADGRMDNALYRYNPTPKYVKAVTLYAERMIEDPLSYRGYWGWQVYYWSTLGDVWLRHGWTLAESRPVTPEDLR